MRPSRVYRYTAYTQAGVLTEGRLQAASLDDAVEMVWDRGLTPFETEEDAAPAASPRRRRQLLSPRKPSHRDVASFTREFATLAQSDIPLDDALRIVSDQLGTGRMRPVITGLLEAVLDGAHLSDAMARHPDVFQDEYVNMVRAGETSGDMARVLGELADLLERRLELAGRLTSALAYPCVLIVAALASIGVIIGVLVPNLAPVFPEGGRSMPVAVALVLRMQEAWPLVAASGAAIGIGMLAAAALVLRSSHLRRAADRILLDLPFAGTLSAEQSCARFARTLGALLRTGVPMLSALASARTSVRNRHVGAGIEAALEAVRDGQSLGRALAGKPGVPQVALRMITVGEETGKLDDMLLRAAVMLEQQSQRRIERMMTLLTPVLTIGIAALVGALILTVMNAILSVNDLAVR